MVRACCSTAASSSSAASTATTSTATAGAPAWPVDAYNQQKSSFQDENFMGFFPDPFQRRNDNSIEQFLNDLNNPLDFPKLQKPPLSPQSLPISPLSVLGGLQDPPLQHHHHHHQQQQQQQQQPKQLQEKQQSFGISRCTTSNAQSTRSKKR